MEERVFAGLRHLGRVRASLPHLHAAVQAEVLPIDDPGVLPVVRRHPLGAMLGLYNVTDAYRPYPGARLRELGLHNPMDAISARAVQTSADDNVWLPPYSYWWVVDAA